MLPSERQSRDQW